MLAVPYAHSFEKNPCIEINSEDKINIKLNDGKVSLKVVERNEH